MQADHGLKGSLRLAQKHIQPINVVRKYCFPLFLSSSKHKYRPFAALFKILGFH